MSERGRILIVDDEPLVRECLVRNIAREGYEVLGADTKAAAVMAIPSWHPDGAVVDLHLPDGNGIELVSLLRTVNPAVRALVVTGFGTIGTAVAALKAGAVDYLCKPFGFGELISILDPGHGSKRERRSLEAASQMTLEQARWEHIQRTLNATKNNISESARRLGIRRQSLQRMLQKRPPALMA